MSTPETLREAVEEIKRLRTRINDNGFSIDAPCPECHNNTILGYLLQNEHAEHMHTRYVCTFWPSPTLINGEIEAEERCGWEGWVVPDPSPDTAFDVDRLSAELVTERNRVAALTTENDSLRRACGDYKRHADRLVGAADALAARLTQESTERHLNMNHGFQTGSGGTPAWETCTLIACADVRKVLAYYEQQSKQ